MNLRRLHRPGAIRHIRLTLSSSSRIFIAGATVVGEQSDVFVDTQPNGVQLIDWF